MISSNFFATLRTADIDTQMNESENALPEKETPGKQGRPHQK
jgi:hypothetical protein